MAFFSTYSSEVENTLEVSYSPGYKRDDIGYQPAFIHVNLPSPRDHQAYLAMTVDEARPLIAMLMSTVMLHDAAQRQALESAA